jgi:hypothetical protein
MKEYTKSELMDELSELYTLQRENRRERKKIKTLIRELELELWKKCDEELDARGVNEKNKKEGK